MWFYYNTNEEFKEEDIQDNFGFVYLITHNPTGRKYIGKKFFTKAATRQVKGKRKKSVSPLTGRNIGVPIKNYKKRLELTGRTTTPVRFYIYAKPVVNVLIGRLGRFLIDMH